jgi:hypothetical protein
MTIVSLINGLSTRRKSQGRIDGDKVRLLFPHPIQNLLICMKECGNGLQPVKQTATTRPVRHTSQVNARDFESFSSHLVPQSGIQNECGQDLYHPDFSKSIRRQVNTQTSCFFFGACPFLNKQGLKVNSGSNLIST